MRGRRVLLGLTLVVLTTGVNAPPAVANLRDELQLVAGSSPEQGRAALVVAVPERFTGATLPEGSFTVLAGDQRLVVSTTAIPPASLSVLAILDTGSTVPTASFDRQRAAVVELARAVEPGTRLGLATTTSPFRLLDATDDRSALLTALGNVTAGGTASPVEAVAAAASLAGSDPGARIVLFSDNAATLTDQLAAAASGVPTDVVNSGGAGATTTAGVLRAHHVTHPLQFVDGLAAELTGQYRLEVTLPEPAPEAVTVRLDAGGRVFELPLTLLTATTDAGAAASTPSPTVAGVSQSRASSFVAATPTTSPPTTASLSATTAAPLTSAPTTQARPANERDDTSVLFWVAVIATPAGLVLMIVALFARRSGSPRRSRRTRRAARRAASAAKPPLLVPRPTSIDGQDDLDGALDDGWPLEDDDLVEDDPLFDAVPAGDRSAGESSADEHAVDEPLTDDRSDDDALPPDDEPTGDALADADEPTPDDLAWADDPGADEMAADGPPEEDGPIEPDDLLGEPGSPAEAPQPSPPDDQPAPADPAVTAGPTVVAVEHPNRGATQTHRHARRPHRWPARRVASITMMVASDILWRRRHDRH